MAISSQYEYPNDGTKRFSFSQQAHESFPAIKRQIDGVTVPAAGSLMTAYTSGTSSWTDSATGHSVIASGVVIAVGDSYGVITHASKVADTTTVALEVDAIYLPLKAAGTPAIGAKAYIDTTLGSITHSSGAGLSLIGSFCDSTVYTNTSNNLLSRLPAGNFCKIKFEGQKVW